MNKSAKENITNIKKRWIILFIFLILVGSGALIFFSIYNTNSKLENKTYTISIQKFVDENIVGKYNLEKTDNGTVTNLEIISSITITNLNYDDYNAQLIVTNPTGKGKDNGVYIFNSKTNKILNNQLKNMLVHDFNLWIIISVENGNFFSLKSK